MFWFALPLSERNKTAASSLTEYAEQNRVDRKTLWAWRQRPDFKARVKELRFKWADDMTSAVLDGWKLACMKGNPLAIELWLKYFHDYIPKTQEIHTQQVEIGVNDIRHLIEQLPEPLKSKHYANLRELLDDASAVANARSPQDSSWSTPAPYRILDEADHDAPNLPDVIWPDAMAGSHSQCLRSDLAWGTFPSNHQGTARGW